METKTLTFFLGWVVALSWATTFENLVFERGSDDNPLWTWFDKYEKGPVAHKWHGCFDVYHRYFNRFRNKPVRFLEIGVQSGGSMEMWKAYFTHPDARFYGLDVNPYLKELFEDLPKVTIYVGSQSNRTFLREAFQNLPDFDIILDDGGHTMEQQIVSLEELYGRVQPNGLYMVEDVATSYWRSFGGGLEDTTDIITFMQYVKVLADRLNSYYFTLPAFKAHLKKGKVSTLKEKILSMGPANFTETTLGIGLYDQMVVFEKGHHPPPVVSKKGKFSMPYTPPQDEDNTAIPDVLEVLKQQLAESKQ